MERMEKKCIDCKEIKPFSEFNGRPNYTKSGKEYLKSQCKPCDVKRMVKWRKKNPEKFSTYQKKYYLDKRKVKKI
jgi:DNA-directed RNA polymerase subunit RPC12/RpoP